MKKHKHELIGVVTLEGYRWCKLCDKWVKVKQVNHLTRGKNG